MTPKYKAQIDERLADPYYRKHFPCTELEVRAYGHPFGHAIAYLKSLNLIIPFEFHIPEIKDFTLHHQAVLARLRLATKSQIRDALLTGILHQPAHSIHLLKRLAALVGLPIKYDSLKPLRKKLHALNLEIKRLEDERDQLELDLVILKAQIRSACK